MIVSGMCSQKRRWPLRSAPRSGGVDHSAGGMFRAGKSWHLRGGDSPMATTWGGDLRGPRRAVGMDRLGPPGPKHVRSTARQGPMTSASQAMDMARPPPRNISSLAE
eukprot:5007554-Pyramimonas_sp.AAC.1